MTSPELSFVALTRRAEPNPRIHTACSQKPSRAKRSWPARLDKGAHWRMALAYAQGVKVDAIAAEYATTTSFVSHVARAFGLPARGRRRQPPNPADVEHLRRWARRKAKALRRDACGWEVLAELE